LWRVLRVLAFGGVDRVDQIVSGGGADGAGDYTEGLGLIKVEVEWR
jgi:hypothetical protein